MQMTMKRLEMKGQKREREREREKRKVGQKKMNSLIMKREKGARAKWKKKESYISRRRENP